MDALQIFIECGSSRGSSGKLLARNKSFAAYSIFFAMCGAAISFLALA
jgi:hypothetical protein